MSKAMEGLRVKDSTILMSHHDGNGFHKNIISKLIWSIEAILSDKVIRVLQFISNVILFSRNCPHPD